MKYIFTILLFLFISGSSQVSYPQNASDMQKREALNHIKYGRFGEAIELLNKYVAANPRIAEGYNLLGLCYEKRNQFEEAVLELRRAVKLAPNNKQIQQNLSRVEKAWYAVIYKKIEGHKREIAINPNRGVNYLEIGKCMKNMGKWDEAETWYDEFLKREDASPDEVIRYSEILARNNHLAKGEKILKTYTERYPNDQRLWSRYGYFTFWLGKNKIAIKAFETALAIKPFFKEAQDGLDAAKGKAYSFEWTDTTARYKKGPKPQEYPIDKYYRILKGKSDDDDSRFLLVNELMKAQRMEEAYQQVQILSKKHNGEDKFQALFDSVTSYRTNLNKKRIEEYTDRLQKNPNDREAVSKIADLYANIMDYQSAAAVLEKYLTNNPGDGNSDLRFKYAKILAWNREFEKAIDQMKSLLEKDPDNLDYQFLRGQITVWTDQDLNIGETYLKNYLAKNPNSLDAIIGLGSLYIKLENMDTAKEYIERAKAIDQDNANVKELQSYFDLQVLRIEEAKVFAILEEGRKLAMDGNCQAGLEKYDEYFSKTQSPSRLVLAEYADVNACAKNFTKSIEIYDQLLSQEYDFDLALQRAKVCLWGADSSVALTQFKKLYAEAPDNYDVQIYLSESYQKMKEYSDARDILENLLTKTTDSTKIAQINQRISWLPVTGLRGILATFPNYVGILPQFTYYWDNMGFQLNSTTGTLDLGLTSFLTIGASFTRGNIIGDYQYFSTQRNFTIFKGRVYLKPLDILSLYASLGSLTYKGVRNRNVMDAGFKVEKEDSYSFSGNYENTDAGLMLFSPYLVNLMDRGQGTQYRITVDRIRLSGSYSSNLGLKFSSNFSYLSLSDGNKGNDFLVRIARKFMPELFVGYEYNFINYARTLSLKTNRDFYYYSPRNFESHSLWAEWNINNVDNFSINLGGKMGYVPASDFILREISGDLSYKPFKNLILSAIITAGGTYRDESAYNYFSTYLSAYISF